jgi:hypothetical protein
VSIVRRLIAVLALALLTNAPAPLQAAQDNPDFYATIVSVTPQSSLVVAPTKDQLITIDVSQLGSTPWNEGAFAVNNVILIRTVRVGDRLVAYGWEQARHGSDSFGSDAAAIALARERLADIAIAANISSGVSASSATRTLDSAGA